MSGFDANWLALREPADRAARSAALVDKLARYVASSGVSRLLDIGCGTGSTWRSLSRHLPSVTGWLLLDNDPLLLDEAKRNVGSNAAIEFCLHDLKDIGGLPLDGIDVVTASALFDLCSQTFCTAFVERIAERACGLYAALNYDGNIRWTVPHQLDDAAVADFNRHQRTDKGLGDALGPDAVACLDGLLSCRGFRVLIEDSPWRMDRHSAELQSLFLNGFRQPLREIGTLSDPDIEAWIRFRLSAIDMPDSLCEVRHSDLLALPA